MGRWVRAAALAELPVGEKLRVEIEDEEIVLIRTEEKIYALEDMCTHAGAALSDVGVVKGCRVMCVLHGAFFDLASGRASGPPAAGDIESFPVRVDNGSIEVELA